MKQPAMPTTMQFILLLPNVPTAALPSDKQRELALALVELLLSAAHENASRPGQGGGDEPEADE